MLHAAFAIGSAVGLFAFQGLPRAIPPDRSKRKSKVNAPHINSYAPCYHKPEDADEETVLNLTLPGKIYASGGLGVATLPKPFHGIRQCLLGGCLGQAEFTDGF